MSSRSDNDGPFSATTYRFDTPNPIEIAVRNQAGTVEISAADTAETTLEIVPNSTEGAELASRTRIYLTQEGTHLRIDVPERKTVRQPALEIIVTVPTGSSLDIETAVAEVQSRGRFDNATVSTASADVSLSHVSGRAQVSTASGDIHLACGEGPVQLRTASGDVRLDASDTEASVQTASGDILIGRLVGELTARSASGDVIVASASTGGVQAKTMSGDVVIGVSAGLLLWLDVNSLSGDVSSELGADESTTGAGPDDDDSASEREPDLRISASTMSGDIVLRRGR